MAHLFLKKSMLSTRLYRPDAIDPMLSTRCYRLDAIDPIISTRWHRLEICRLFCRCWHRKIEKKSMSMPVRCQHRPGIDIDYRLGA
jgi:hypothetical protein